MNSRIPAWYKGDPEQFALDNLSQGWGYYGTRDDEFDPINMILGNLPPSISERICVVAKRCGVDVEAAVWAALHDFCANLDRELDEERGMHIEANTRASRRTDHIQSVVNAATQSGAGMT